ncbi:hypothetical protein NDU88_004651 [Pleurodeles waltl]|uniref:Uncharacterized protein n=1 Tax=Pleurodeles waltl TaxID=8319 RepID=A0AAV7WVZ9_PLEWA|nr:hypothetical protein NDU88_004651 [Pleurodeles waltl]
MKKALTLEEMQKWVDEGVEPRWRWRRTLLEELHSCSLARDALEFASEEERTEAGRLGVGLRGKAHGGEESLRAGPQEIDLPLEHA